MLKIKKPGGTVVKIGKKKSPSSIEKPDGTVVKIRVKKHKIPEKPKKTKEGD